MHTHCIEDLDSGQRTIHVCHEAELGAVLDANDRVVALLAEQAIADAYLEHFGGPGLRAGTVCALDASVDEATIAHVNGWDARLIRLSDGAFVAPSWAPGSLHPAR